MYVPLQENRYHKNVYLSFSVYLSFLFRRFLFSRIWTSAQDHAVLVLLLNIVGFFIYTWPRWSGANVLYHSCTTFEEASREGQPLNFFTWFIGAGGYGTLNIEKISPNSVQLSFYTVKWLLHRDLRILRLNSELTIENVCHCSRVARQKFSKVSCKVVLHRTLSSELIFENFCNAMWLQQDCTAQILESQLCGYFS